MNPNVIYITLVRVAEHGIETKSQNLELPKRHFITVGEVLLRFDIVVLRPSDKIWMKRDGSDFRLNPYTTHIQLPIDTFFRFTMVIAEDLSKAREILYYKPPSAPVEPKRERRGPARHVLLREKAKLGIIRKKRKARIANLKKASDEDEKPPES